jgi:hypothetical protein
VVMLKNEARLVPWYYNLISADDIRRKCEISFSFIHSTVSLCSQKGLETAWQISASVTSILPLKFIIHFTLSSPLRRLRPTILIIGIEVL